jgi:hypothetical protein
MPKCAIELKCLRHLPRSFSESLAVKSRAWDFTVGDDIRSRQAVETTFQENGRDQRWSPPGPHQLSLQRRDPHQNIVQL